MRETKSAIGYGLGAGLLGVLCCVGPLVPILIGFGSATAFFGLDRYRPLFIVGGVFILALASWLIVRRRHRCCDTRNRWTDFKIVLLIFGSGIATYGGMFYVVVPALSKLADAQVTVKESSRALSSHPAVPVETMMLKVEGMTCAGCAVGVKQALLDVPGVSAAEVAWETGQAQVTYDPGKTRPNRILNAEVQEHYQLSVLPSGPNP